MKKNHMLLANAKTLNSKEMKQVKGGVVFVYRCTTTSRCSRFYFSCTNNCPFGGICIYVPSTGCFGPIW